jgi:3-oxoacyl-[acyl-carrier-protein] synthase II
LAAGAQAVAAACEQIRSGRADMMFAGGVDALSAGALHGLNLCGDVSEVGGVPFDVAHDGLTPAEGAAILVLEEHRHAAARGATIYGGILADGSQAAADLVLSGANGHPATDAAEAGLANRFAAGGTPVTAIKSMFGEPGGAAAGLQIMAGICAMAGTIPPTLHLERPQEDLQLEVVTDTGRRRDIRSFAVTSADAGEAGECLTVATCV